MINAIIISGPIDWILATAAVIAALMVILKPVRTAAQFLIQVRDEWHTIMERLDDLEQLKPNGGNSLADHVDQLRRNQQTVMHDLVELREAVERLTVD